MTRTSALLLIVMSFYFTRLALSQDPQQPPGGEWGQELREKTSGTFPSTLPDGSAIVFASGDFRGLAFLRNQRVSPESFDYDWFLRKDGLIDFNPDDPAVEHGTVTGATKSIAFGPFRANWSINTTGFGYLYLSGVDSLVGVIFGATPETISTRIRSCSLLGRGKHYQFAVPDRLVSSEASTSTSSPMATTPPIVSPARRSSDTHRPDDLVFKRARITDPDGYVFVRAGSSTNAPVIGEIRQGQDFYVCEDPYSEWWFVTKALTVRNGFIHKSRVKILPNDRSPDKFQ